MLAECGDAAFTSSVTVEQMANQVVQWVDKDFGGSQYKALNYPELTEIWSDREGHFTVDRIQIRNQRAKLS